MWLQSYQSFHLFLVDNGSGGEDGSILKQQFGNHPKVTFIQNEENFGFTRGNNKIISELLETYPNLQYIALLNNDTTVHRNWLKALVESAKDHQADLVSSKMINYYYPNYMDNAGHRVLNTAEILPIGHMEPIKKHNKVVENMGSCAGATLYSASMLREIGGFDAYFDTGYEDAELGLRACILGYKSIFEPKAIVHHKVSASVNKIRDYQYLLKIQQNIFYTWFKVMPLSVLLFNLPAFLLKYSLLLLIDLLFFRWTFLKMILHAFYTTLFQERSKILAARRSFFQKNKSISFFKIQKRLEFFLWFDIKRFVKYIVLRKPTHFEKKT